MASTGEVKDAVRLAQQYNVQIYRYLIDGLVNSSLKGSQLKAELEEYTRSSMKFFDRLLQIRNATLPCLRIREEQINVFREQMKRNDWLRQEVHNVQRGLWRLREMGQKVPMADKHLIIQGFPELCVSTSPDKVPLTVLCDQILHKYNLRNERHIMDILRWADEQSEARRLARQTPSPPLHKTSKPEACPCENVENDEKRFNTPDQVIEDHISLKDDDVINEVTPVPSWCDFDQPFPTDDGTKEVTPVPSWCDFEQEIPVTMSLQEMEGYCFLNTAEELKEGKGPGSLIMAEDLIVAGIKTPYTVGKETRVIEDTMSFKASSAVCQETRIVEKVREGDDLDELMSLLQDIPELEPDYTYLPASSSTTQVAVNSEINSAVPSTIGQKPQPKPTDKVDLEAQSAIAITNLKQKMFAEHEHLHQLSYSAERVDKTCENVENHAEPTPVTGEAAVIPDKKEQVSNTTKPVLRDLHKLKEIQSTVKESLKEVIAGIIKESPFLDTTSLSRILPKHENTQTMPTDFLREGACKQRVSLQQTKISRPAEGSKVSVHTQKVCDIIPRTLVGSDKPHVYENKINRKQHGTSSVTQNMTAGEILEYEKKRDVALQAVELKKQRTKLLLNQQFEKSSQKKSSIHYYKVQNTPKLKSFSKSASVPTRPSSNNKNNQTCKSSPDSSTTLGSSSEASRKRSASSFNTGPVAKRARSSRPRIILRIFRDEDDWNVEQVINRY